MSDSKTLKTSNSNVNDAISIRKNKYLFVAAISLLIYSLIECSDSIAIILIAFDIIPNIYLDFDIVIPEIRHILQTQPFYFIPLFWGFTLMRIVSTIGILKNLLWGFWIATLSLIITMILTILFLPFGFFEIFFCIIILILLIIGYCNKKPII
ncbi:MAG: hypothetical protein ACTSRI_15455 [Promethearchaeota archaeon]